MSAPAVVNGRPALADVMTSRVYGHLVYSWAAGYSWPAIVHVQQSLCWTAWLIRLPQICRDHTSVDLHSARSLSRRQARLVDQDPHLWPGKEVRRLKFTSWLIAVRVSSRGLCRSC